MLSRKAEAAGTGDETAEYIRDMALELRRLAKSRRLEFLAYLLAMAAEEADAAAWEPGTLKRTTTMRAVGDSSGD